MNLTNVPKGISLRFLIHDLLREDFPNVNVRVHLIIDIPVKQMIERVCRVLEQDYESVMHDPTVGRPDTGVYTARYVITKILREWYEYNWYQISQALTLRDTTVRRQYVKTNSLLSCGDTIMTEAYEKALNNLLYES